VAGGLAAYPSAPASLGLVMGSVSERNVGWRNAFTEMY